MIHIRGPVVRRWKNYLRGDGTTYILNSSPEIIYDIGLPLKVFFFSGANEVVGHVLKMCREHFTTLFKNITSVEVPSLVDKIVTTNYFPKQN